MASEVERIALEFVNVKLAKAEGKFNPITGQHVELTVQPISEQDIDKAKLLAYLNSKMPNHMLPRRLKVATISVGHRFKKA